MTFGSQEEQSRTCNRVRLSVVIKGGRTKQLILFTVPVICEPLACQPVSFCQENFDQLVGFELADPSDGHSSLGVDILIGSDQYWDLTTGNTRRGNAGPIAIETELGWVLSGPVASPSQNQPSTCLVTHTLRVDSISQDARVLDDRLKSFWDLESFGIVGSDQSVYDKFGSSVRFAEGRYEVELPWKESHPILPDNYHLCLRRLNGLMRRLKQDPDVLREYNSTIKDQLQRGIVERVNRTPEDSEVPDKIHYLPHHPVIRRDKETTKVRVVYDASAREDGPSLNDCLHTGPKFDQKIMDILVRFRVHRIAVTADIEKAFLMVAMSEKDRDALRFLWFEDAFSDQPTVVALRFTRVVFGVSPSPFLLNATIRHHLEQYLPTQPDLVKKLSKSIYVDDIVTGADDEEQARQVFQRSKDLLKEGGFNLRKFCSNTVSLQAAVDQEEGVILSDHHPGTTQASEDTYTHCTLGTGQKIRSGELKVLGVHWNVSSDHLVMGLEEIAATARELEPTKRNIVSLVGKFYDPLGFLAPIVIRFKIFFQSLCSAHLEWDQPLSGALLEQWLSLKSCLEEAQVISVPRCYLIGVSDRVVSCTLCGFCDASLKTYAGVVYVLLETVASCAVRFVAAKTRVAPLKEQTIPRLELLSALLLARLITNLAGSLEGELPLSRPICFTDSTVALCWIKGTDKTWKPFVQNRVCEIRKLIPPEYWSHCSGKGNRADIPSRGLSPLEFSVNSLWRNGPDWLSRGEYDEDSVLEPPQECLAEMRAKDLKSVHGLLTTGETTGISQVINCEDYSSWDRLLAVTAAVLKFNELLLSHIRPESGVSCDQNVKAEEVWLLKTQRNVTSDSMFKQWQRQLDLFIDEKGLWRCRGRIQNASVSYSTKHPILLPRNHYVSTLLVQKAHDRVLHNGVKETLAEIRSRFWIVKGRSFVKKILRQCRLCRRYEGSPYSAPLPPPLPSYRVEEAPAFSFTGIDFAGPLHVRNDGHMKKVWICLFTCCVVRAVHLDLVPDMTTSAFLRCLKRFIARRGLPCKILSDNGKTFKAAAKTIRAVVDHPDVKRYLAGLGVKWIFNLPKAPWWGGVFERMIRSTKRCLRKILGQARFSVDELLTALAEVEMVINSRPISYVAAEDLEEPLTPSHLLIGRRLMSFPDHLCHEPEEYEETPDILTRRARYLNSTIDQFWERWRREYLLELRESQRHHHGVPAPSEIAVGDVVIVHSDQPRCLWKLGTVEETLDGADGKIRGAVVRVFGQGKKATCLRRLIQRLYPLEIPNRIINSSHSTIISNCPQDSVDDSEVISAQCSETAEPPRRSSCAAASIARDRLLAQTFAEDL